MSDFLAQFHASRDAFRGILSEEVLALRERGTTWELGDETLSLARKYFLQSTADAFRVEIGLVNDSSMTATWYRLPHAEDSYAIAVNRGLVEAIELIAIDVFGYGAEDEGELVLGTHDADAGKRVAARVAAYLEIGFPLGEDPRPSRRRAQFVRAIVEDALQFLVLHEFAHILLGHQRGDVHLLRNRLVDLQIATFSIGQEHQADRLAARLHASMRRESAQSFPGMEFAGPMLFFGVLGLFERYTRYQAAFDSPHAHPPAYERLFRLRVYYASGDGHMYWAIPEKAGHRLARLDLDPHPEAIMFSDAVAKSLLSVLELVEEADVLRSPINDLFNRLAAVEIDDQSRSECWYEICRWLYLGSPRKILQHVAEASRSIRTELEKSVQDEDRLFLERSSDLIDAIASRVPTLDDYSVRRAAQDSGLLSC